MTFEHLQSLLFIWKVRLGLSDWRLEMILGGGDDETSYMELEHSVFYQRAIIHISPWLVDDIIPTPQEVLMRDHLTDDFIESSLVHELLHLYTRQLRDIIRSDLFGLIGRETHEQIKNNMERVDEMMIDKLAEALVRAFNERFV